MGFDPAKCGGEKEVAIADERVNEGCGLEDDLPGKHRPKHVGIFVIFIRNPEAYSSRSTVYELTCIPSSPPKP